MPTITIKFSFSRTDEDHFDYCNFEVEGGLLGDIDDCKDDMLSDLNSLVDDAEEWVFDEFDIDVSDEDFAEPTNFNDLDDYAEYVEKCKEHGEGYRLRYDDIGEFNFNDQYNGCWGSEEDFIQDLCESCYETPDWLEGYIDWERITRDYMMDYSSYEGSDGIHIFRE